MIGDIYYPEREGPSEAKAIVALRSLKDSGAELSAVRTCQPFQEWLLASEGSMGVDKFSRYEHELALVRVLFQAGWQSEAWESFVQCVGPAYDESNELSQDFMDEVGVMARVMFNATFDDVQRALNEGGYC